MNLFLGIIFYNFTFTRKSAHHKHLTDSQQMWIDLMSLVTKSSPNQKETLNNNTRLKKICSKLLKKRILQTLVLSITAINLIFLTLWNTKFEKENEEIIKYFSIFTIFLNITEGLVKTLSTNPKIFLAEPWNFFDILIIVINSTELFPIFLNFYSDSSNPLSAIRVVTIFRFLTLFPKKSGVKKLLMTFAYSFPIVFNLFIILLLILFIYSMAGCIFFSGIDIGNDINFSNFFYALVSLLKVATADEWVPIMMKIKAVYGKIKIIYIFWREIYIYKIFWKILFF